MIVRKWLIISVNFRTNSAMESVRVPSKLQVLALKEISVTLKQTLIASDLSLVQQAIIIQEHKTLEILRDKFVHIRKADLVSCCILASTT